MTFISAKFLLSEIYKKALKVAAFLFNICNEDNVNRCSTNDSVEHKLFLNNYLSLSQMLHTN